MENNCVNCKNSIEENSVYYCKLLKLPKYEEGGNPRIEPYKVVDPNINFHCKEFEASINLSEIK